MTARLTKPFVYRRAGDGVYFEAVDGERLFGTSLHRASVTTLVRQRSSGVEYLCILGSGVTARITDVRGGSELRVFAGRDLLATATVRPRSSVFRVSTRCEER